MSQHPRAHHAGAPPVPPHTQGVATVPIPPVRWATAAASVQPQRSGIMQPRRPEASIPPVRFPQASGAGPQRVPSVLIQGNPGNAIPPVRIVGTTQPVQPDIAGTITPHRDAVSIPPGRLPGASGGIQRHRTSLGEGNPVTRTGQPHPSTQRQASCCPNHRVTGAAPGEKERLNVRSIVSLRRLSQVVQRMVGCKWCTIPGCLNGSLCSSKSANVGTYSSRTQDQSHLSSMFGQGVSGKTHQMEHPFGYKVLAGPMHQQGQRATTPATRQIEQQAPAYHEQYSQHRKHEGTGSGNEPKESGLGGKAYREWQRTALEDDNPDIAMAINQMTYAHQQMPRDPIGKQQASDSYTRMVRNMGPIPMGTATGVAYTSAPTDDQKFDMLVYRFQVEHHRDPNDQEILMIIAENKLHVSWL